MSDKAISVTQIVVTIVLTSAYRNRFEDIFLVLSEQWSFNDHVKVRCERNRDLSLINNNFNRIISMIF